MQVMNNIKSWANEDQPIYKMYKKGAKNLSDVELLAIILQHGTIHQNAVELARSLLNAAQNNLQKFSKLSVADILGLKIKGIGKIKAEGRTIDEIANDIQNKVNENTIVFNNLVQNKQDFEQNWRVELKNSWHKNLLTLV